MTLSSISPIFNKPRSSNYPLPDTLRSVSRHHSSKHRQRPQHPRRTPTMDYLRLLPHLRLLPPPLGPPRGHIRKTADLHLGIRMGDCHHDRRPVRIQRDHLRHPARPAGLRCSSECTHGYWDSGRDFLARKG